MRHLFFTLSLACLAAASACDPGSDPVTPAGDRPSMAAAVTGAELTIGGPWSWQETTDIRLRPEAVGIFGIAAEGPVTHLKCAVSGELTIVQNGTDFTGDATQSGWCTTKGGQAVDPSAVFPPTLQLVDGSLRGRSLSFTIDTGVFPCLYSGSVRVEAHQVSELRATGHCEVPREVGSDRIWWSAVR